MRLYKKCCNPIAAQTILCFTVILYLQPKDRRFLCIACNMQSVVALRPPDELQYTAKPVLDYPTIANHIHALQKYFVDLVTILF